LMGIYQLSLAGCEDVNLLYIHFDDQCF